MLNHCILKSENFYSIVTEYLLVFLCALSFGVFIQDTNQYLTNVLKDFLILRSMLGLSSFGSDKTNSDLA